MLRVLTNASDIKRAQQQLVSKMQAYVDEEIPVVIGYQGGRFKGKVKWSKKLGVWIYNGRGLKNKYLNLFGIGKPVKGSMIPIACEINIPAKGIERRVGGAFAKDESGNIYLVHRGRIGGGKKGIGKQLFEDKYRGEWVEVEDGKVISDIALIGALRSSRLGLQIKQFINEVVRIKSQRTSKKAKKPSTKHKLSKEFSGKKKYKSSQIIEADCDHGLVVDALASILQNKYGDKVANDRHRDLYIHRKKSIIKTFEVKTDTSTTSIYSGIGQLLFNGSQLPKRPELIFVSPNDLSREAEKSINRLGIDVLRYRWRGDRVIFLSSEI